MCELCDVENGATCPDCGRLICFDVSWPGDDVLRPAMVTSSGDLYCAPCGMTMDKLEEDDEENLEEDDWEEPGP